MILPDLTAFDADAAAGPVVAGIRQERWRKARDAAKELCRKDKSRYLPLLIAANAGLAQDLLSRGLIKDAAPVLEYLKTIAPPELLAALHAQQKKGEATAALQKAAGGKPENLATWRLAESGALALEAGKEPTQKSIAAADGLVTATWTFPGESSPFEVELRAVRAAVQATGDGSWEVAREALQALPRRSLFAHWRFFLRGVRHAHLAEKTEAQRCFDALPSGSSLQRAAALYRDLLGLPSPVPAPEEAAMGILAVMAGVPTWAAPLTEAQRHWKRGQLDKAYEALALPLRQHFPTEEPGLAAILTDVMMASCAAKSPLPHEAQQDLVELFLERYHGEKFRSDRERLFAMRFFLHEDGKRLDPVIAEEYGNDLAKTWTRLRKKDPLRESAIWTMIAGVQMEPHRDGSLPRPTRTSQAVLLRILEKAASLDPQNPAPGVRLARFHQATENQSAYNKQLTSLVKSFPEAKAVLQLSAEESIRRKSWSKALKTLRQARTADPSDSLVSSQMLMVLQEQAIALFKKTQPVPDSLWEEMEPLLLDLPALPAQVPEGFALGRSRWVAYALQGCLARPGQSDEAARLAPSLSAHFFLLHLLRKDSGLKQSPALPANDVTWQDMIWIAHLLKWDDGERKRNRHENFALSSFLKSCLQRIKSSGKVTEDPGSLMAVAHRFLKGSLESNQPNGPPWTETCGEIATLVGPASRKKESSYQIRIAAWILPDRWDPHEVITENLQALMEEAAAAGDLPARELALHYLELARKRARGETPPTPWGEDNEDYDDDEDDDGDEWVDESEPTAGELDGAFTAIRTMAAAIKLMSGADLKHAKRQLQALGMPLDAWKTMESLASLMASDMSELEARQILESTPSPLGPPSPLPPPPLPRPPPPKKPAPPRLPDPQQPELF